MGGRARMFTRPLLLLAIGLQLTSSLELDILNRFSTDVQLTSN